MYLTAEVGRSGAMLCGGIVGAGGNECGGIDCGGGNAAECGGPVIVTGGSSLVLLGIPSKGGWLVGANMVDVAGCRCPTEPKFPKIDCVLCIPGCALGPAT